MFVLPWNKNALLALCSPDTCVTPRVVFTRSSSVMISICKSGSIPNPTAVGGREERKRERVRSIFISNQVMKRMEKNI